MDFKINQAYQYKNDCYKQNRWIKPKGIVVHSTACPGVKAYPRFVLGWNRGGIQKCVHGWVDSDAIYQTLPWNHKGWHAGGTFNSSHIGFEIAEPKDYKDTKYFQLVWDRAVWLCAYLCKLYNLTEKDILCHSEAHRLNPAYASNHADVMHWFPKVGKDMNQFRAAVGAILHPEPIIYTVKAGDCLPL